MYSVQLKPELEIVRVIALSIPLNHQKADWLLLKHLWTLKQVYMVWYAPEIKVEPRLTSQSIFFSGAYHIVFTS